MENRNFRSFIGKLIVRVLYSRADSGQTRVCGKLVVAEFLDFIVCVFNIALKILTVRSNQLVYLPD